MTHEHQTSDPDEIVLHLEQEIAGLRAWATQSKQWAVDTRAALLAAASAFRIIPALPEPPGEQERIDTP